MNPVTMKANDAMTKAQVGALLDVARRLLRTSRIDNRAWLMSGIKTVQDALHVEDDAAERSPASGETVSLSV